MKRTISILFMMLLGCALYAGPVTPEKALRVAQSVFSSAPGTKAAGESELQIVWDGEFEPATKGALDPAFYVITRPEGGFVMVAGSDNVQPVLAFSFENDFVVEGMPEHIRYWMEQYKRYVRHAGAPTVDIQEQWAVFEETKATAAPITTGFINPYTASHTNEWNQTNPANFYCPDVEGQTQTSVCGCTALAVAEVIAWFGGLNKTLTSYTIPSYTYQSANEQYDVVVSEHALTTSYTAETWLAMKGLDTAQKFYETVKGFSKSNMIAYLYYGENKNRPGEEVKNTLTPLGESIAHLVYDIGTLLQSRYNEGNSAAYHYGTGAYPDDIQTNVAPAFKYSNTARLVEKDLYTKSQWQKMLKDEISLRPVLYFGYSESGGGHAYVADGYATYNNGLVFHFNMGWGGMYNGYYTLEIQDEFDRDLYALLGFYPSDSFAAVPYIGFRPSDGRISDITGYYTPTLEFRMEHFFNYGAVSFYGDIYAGRENYSGTLLQTESIMPDLELNTREGYSSVVRSATFSDAVFGDRIYLYYKEKDKSDYLPFDCNRVCSRITAVPFFPAAAINKKSSYVTGDLFVFELTNHTYDYSSSAWTVTTPSGVTTDYTADSDALILSEVGDYKITCTTPGEETLVTYITVTAQ